MITISIELQRGFDLDDMESPVGLPVNLTDNDDRDICLPTGVHSKALMSKQAVRSWLLGPLCWDWLFVF